MKSPAQLAAKLTRDWQRADVREARLLDPAAWPLQLSIPPPQHNQITGDLPSVRRHFDQWRCINVGEVIWQAIKYRSLAEPEPVPVRWILRKPSEWVEATRNHQVANEYARIGEVIDQLDGAFEAYFIRKRHWLKKSNDDVVKAGRVSLQLSPGCLEGAPLRSLSGYGVDTKFVENHQALITDLLDLRFNGLPSEVGLIEFLNAADESDHWLLIADLDGELLPYSRIRLRDRDVQSQGLPASRILVVENERCLHLLPKLENTIAVLGAGLNLEWLSAPWLKQVAVAYWGDIDTWGMKMLGRAQQLCTGLVPLLMDAQTYQQHKSFAVEEPNPSESVTGLDVQQQAFAKELRSSCRGRLEQEFLPKALVHSAVNRWLQQPATPRVCTQCPSNR